MITVAGEAPRRATVRRRPPDPEMAQLTKKLRAGPRRWYLDAHPTEHGDAAMTLIEACDRMNRRGAGPATGCEVVVAEDGDLLAYVTFANASPSPMLTAWFPAAIRRLDPEACRVAIRNASSWQIHSGFKVE